MEFEVFATNVDLQDIPSYTTSITLEGQLLKLSFLWNERIGKRTIFIRNSADVCYLQNTILHPNESFELNSNAAFDDLPYKVVLQKVGDTNKVGNIYNWSKDFILCFYRTVDVETEKLNVKYGVTTPSTPTLPKPDPIFRDWILYNTVTISDNGFAHYNGYKTNGRETYISFADLNLVDSISNSLHDVDLRTWQGVTDAINYFTSGEPYTWHDGYIEFDGDIYGYYYSVSSSDPYNDRETPELACKVKGEQWEFIRTAPDVLDSMVGYCRAGYNDGNVTYFRRVLATGLIQVQFINIAEQIIKNLLSGNVGIQLHADNYIEMIANSIFNANPSNRYVLIDDLIPHFELNKYLVGEFNPPYNLYGSYDSVSGSVTLNWEFDE